MIQVRTVEPRSTPLFCIMQADFAMWGRSNWHFALLPNFQFRVEVLVMMMGCMIQA